MKQKCFWLYVLLTLLFVNKAHGTTQFRTPLDFIRENGHYHCDPYNTTNDDINSDDDSCSEKHCKMWPFNVSLRSGLYERFARKSFVSDKCAASVTDPCESSCSSTSNHKKSLSALWFGKSAFKAEEAFAGGMITSAADLKGNPAVAFSTITPHFKYTEKGAWVGIDGDCRLGKKKKWNIGFRTSIPFKVIEVEPAVLDRASMEEGLAGVIAESILELDAGATGNAIDYAYRLDFLSTLIRASFTTPLPLVQYGTGIATNDTKIAGISVGASSRNQNNTNIPPIYVIKSTTGAIPEPAILPGSTTSELAYAKQYSQVETTALPTTGAGTDGKVYFFDNSSDYAALLGMDRAAQSTLFVVPRMINSNTDNSAETPSNLATLAISIRSAVTELLDQLDLFGQDSAIAFLKNNCCIDLGKYERVLGIGDLQAEMYWGYGPESKKWYIDNVIGVVFPTGKADKDPRRVFYQTTGNNKHFELKVGLETGWNPCKYFGIKGDVSYNHAFKKSEKRAAPFAGATIKNIGVPINVDVSWDTVLGHVDATFLSPHCKNLGFSVGYEGYFKTRDRIDSCQTTAVDCLGNTQPLDPCILKNCSSTVAHKVRGELFYRCRYFECIMGASHVVAGRNVMQETEAHIGSVIYF